MQKLKKLTAVIALTIFILCSAAPVFAETDNKVREMANETIQETDNKVREMANETFMETDNNIREMGLATAFEDFIAFFGL